MESDGALEAAPALNAADIIVDIVSSGVTLRENRLKRLVGGTIVESEACLIGNRSALRDSPEKLEIVRQVLELIEAQMRSRDYFSLTGNIRGDSPEAVARRVTSHTEVAGLRGPTISKVYPKLGGEEGWYAATVVVQSKLLLQAIDALRRAGAGDVSVAPLRYMFQSKCWSFEALRRQLSDRQRRRMTSHRRSADDRPADRTLRRRRRGAPRAARAPLARRCSAAGAGRPEDPRGLRTRPDGGRGRREDHGRRPS